MWCASAIFVLGSCVDPPNPTSDGTYVLNANGWSRISTDSPSWPAGGCSEMVMAPKQRGLMYMHIATGVPPDVNETYLYASRWSGTSWSPDEVIAPLPADASGCDAVFDPASGRMFLLISEQSSSSVTDSHMFEYDGTSLVESPAVIPQTGLISNVSLTYDSKLQSVVLVTIAPSPTGATGEGAPSAALWRWSDSGWVSIPDSTTPISPSGTDPWRVVYDVGSDTLVLFGNRETLTWNGKWTLQSESSLDRNGVDPTNAMHATYDPSLNAIVIMSVDRVLWTWTGSGWGVLVPAPGNVPLTGDIAYDTARMELLALATQLY